MRTKREVLERIDAARRDERMNVGIVLEAAKVEALFDIRNMLALLARDKLLAEADDHRSSRLKPDVRELTDLAERLFEAARGAELSGQ